MLAPANRTSISRGRRNPRELQQGDPGPVAKNSPSAVRLSEFGAPPRERYPGILRFSAGPMDLHHSSAVRCPHSPNRECSNSGAVPRAVLLYCLRLRTIAQTPGADEPLREAEWWAMTRKGCSDTRTQIRYRSYQQSPADPLRVRETATEFPCQFALPRSDLLWCRDNS